MNESKMISEMGLQATRQKARPIYSTILFLFLAFALCAYLLIRVMPLPIDDPATFEYIGIQIDHGAKLYTDIWDNKLPPIYYVYALLNVVAPRNFYLHAVFFCAINILASLGFALVLKKSGFLKVSYYALLYVFITSFAQFDFSAPEYLASVFLNFSVYAAMCKRPLYAAILLVCATFFWIPSIALSIIPFLLVDKRQRLMFTFSYCSIGALSFLSMFSMLGNLAFMHLLGSWRQYIQSSDPSITLRKVMRNLLNGLEFSGLLIVLSVPCILWPRRWSYMQKVALAWLALALLGAVPSHRFYPHYFIPSIAPALILAILSFSQIDKRKFSTVALRLVLLVFVVAALSYPTLRNIVDSQKYMKKSENKALLISNDILKENGKDVTLDIYGEYLPQVFLASNLRPTRPEGLVSQALIDSDESSHLHVMIPFENSPDTVVVCNYAVLKPETLKRYHLYREGTDWKIYTKIN